MSKIRKAIIPTAGLGTRFLPATKTVPKEMLTIVDAPIILYVVEEAVEAGIEDIILIAGRGKQAIEDFFDTTYELEDKLMKDGKIGLLERVIRIREKANVISIRQKQALGLGHAVHCGKPIVGSEPFAVLLGDEITVANKKAKTAIHELVDVYDETGSSCFSVMEVAEKDVSKYGIADISGKQGSHLVVSNLIEKPKPSETKSRWAITGRYVFNNEIFQDLENVKPGYNGEIQLTDAMKTLCARSGILAQPLSATRYDAGDKLGYLIANIEIALKDPTLEKDLKDYLLHKNSQLRGG
ncbi:MAG: UTP--glucose-1-phosphate uridylyltransferase GalU [Bdellovibrionota bacterium]